MKIEFKAAQIAALLGGKVEGDPETKVWNVACIEDGAPGMLSFLSNPKYIQYLYTHILLHNHHLYIFLLLWLKYIYEYSFHCF